MEEYRAGYRILVADDDINVHQSLNTYFRREGYQMISAYDGQEAIDHVRKSRPDIALLDIMMPKMDGLMVCREIRKESNLPIIMLTAKGEEFDKLLGLELGADDYITKPFSPREVLARVKAVLRRMHELKDSGKASHLVVSMMMGRFVSLRISRQTMRPSIFGIMMSKSTMSGRDLRTWSMASCPS